jgi:hypothetical protein
MASTAVYGVPSPAYTVPASTATVYQTRPSAPPPVATQQTVHTTTVSAPSTSSGGYGIDVNSQTTGYAIMGGIVVFLIIIFLIWWLIAWLIRPTGRNNGEKCSDSDQCQGFCNGFGLCESGAPIQDGDFCTITSQCEVRSACEPSILRPEHKVCTPLLL